MFVLTGGKARMAKPVRPCVVESAPTRSLQSVMQVSAVAYDNPIPGFKTNNTINLRLWAAKPDREFDLEAFNTGDYVQVCHGSWLFPNSAYVPVSSWVPRHLSPCSGWG